MFGHLFLVGGFLFWKVPVGEVIRLQLLKSFQKSFYVIDCLNHINDLNHYGQ